MQFSNPVGLWAMTGLLLPVAIHLLSRKEGGIIEFGSLRHLRESPTAKFRQIRLNELALLFLRCLLVTLLAFALAGFQLNRSAEKRKWVILDEGIQESGNVQRLLENFRNEGFEIRLIARDFPLSSADRPAYFDNYWAAVKALEEHTIDTVVAISYNYQRKFRGPRIAMPPKLKWIVVDPLPDEFIAQQFRMSKDSTWVRRGYTSSSSTYYETQVTGSGAQPDTVPLPDVREVEVTLINDERFDLDKKIVLASLEAIQAVTPHKINIATKKVTEWNDSISGFVFWLSPETPPEMPGVTTLAFLRCAGENTPLLIQADLATPYCGETAGVSWAITRRLNEAAALNENLPIQLARIILPHENPPTADRRSLPESMTWSSRNLTDEEGVKKQAATSQDLLLLFILFALVFTGERLLAFKRDQ